MIFTKRKAQIWNENTGWDETNFLFFTITWNQVSRGENSPDISFQYFKLTNNSAEKCREVKESIKMLKAKHAFLLLLQALIPIDNTSKACWPWKLTYAVLCRCSCSNTAGYNALCIWCTDVWLCPWSLARFWRIHLLLGAKLKEQENSPLVVIILHISLNCLHHSPYYAESW